MAGKGMLAEKSGDWYYFMRKTFTRFLLACWNLGNFKNRLEGGRCERLCISVYMQHEVRPFVRRGVLGAILYILWRRRLYHKALLAIQVFLGPTTSKIRQVIENSYAVSCRYSFMIEKKKSCLGSWQEVKK